MLLLAANVALNFFLVVHPPLGQEGNIVVLDKYPTSEECKAAMREFSNQGFTQRTNCIQLPRPSTSNS